MKIRGIFIIVCSGIIFLSCNQDSAKTKTTTEQTENSREVDTIGEVSEVQEIDHSKDKEEIQNLIRKTLKWADAGNRIDLLPMLKDSLERVYIGFDLHRHEANLDRLRETGFFANEFIENYNRIILTLDRKIRNHEFEEWFVGDLPVFGFLGRSNPWCTCPDVPYDDPNPWDYIETEVMELNEQRGQLIWRWGGPDLNPGWSEFSSAFGVVKENGKWKIAFLQGFDFEESTR